jgi:hypothetical protein
VLPPVSPSRVPVRGRAESELPASGSAQRLTRSPQCLNNPAVCTSYLNAPLGDSDGIVLPRRRSPKANPPRRASPTSDRNPGTLTSPVFDSTPLLATRCHFNGRHVSALSQTKRQPIKSHRRGPRCEKPRSLDIELVRCALLARHYHPRVEAPGSSRTQTLPTTPLAPLPAPIVP